MQKEYIIDYINKGKYIKLERELKKYNLMAFRQLQYVVYPALLNGKVLGKKVGINGNKVEYIADIPTDALIEQIYGRIKLHYFINKKDNTIVLETITPEELFKNDDKCKCIYKGIKISKSESKKDMFKTDFKSLMKKYK